MPSGTANRQRLILRVVGGDVIATGRIEEWLEANSSSAWIACAELASPSRIHGRPMVAVAVEGLSRGEVELIRADLAELGAWDLAIGSAVLQSDAN